MNDFQECLKSSHAASDLPFWEVCYRRAFPTMMAMHDHRQDGEHQRAGIDRSVILSNGKTIWIDEKVRWRNKETGKVYGDIALEYLSDELRKSPGWVAKPLLCDYIAYAIAPLGKCYLLPVIALQGAWVENGEAWLKSKECHKIRARNNGWTTLSLCIPVSILFPAIGKMLRVDFDPMEEAS